MVSRLTVRVFAMPHECHVSWSRRPITTIDGLFL
jgi:hypothetical protein